MEGKEKKTLVVQTCGEVENLTAGEACGRATREADGSMMDGVRGKWKCFTIL